ncbi:hypothetical protein WJX73_010815 [Symbiochloris irregularis]|uniref:Uncharacterized protein n=1 Tax=Symbiochloris irregularis TaxID=706552 RepID=A0AAW1PIU7_9CHLO
MRRTVTLAKLLMGLSRITDASVARDDRRIILIATTFGFSASGHVDLELKKFQYYLTPGDAEEVNLSRLGFFVTAPEAETQLEVDRERGVCPLDSAAASVVTLLTFDKVEQGSNATRLRVPLREQLPDFEGGYFSLFYANCEPDVLATFDIRVSLYNVRSNGKKDYLSVGEDVLPLVFMVMFVLFAVATALWAALVVRSRQDAHRIHHLMTALAAAKTLTLLSEAGMYHFVRATGRPDGWNIAYYVFTFLRGLLFFSVVVLVGTGWSYMKALLAKREKRILMIVIPLQVCAEVAIVVLDENTPVSRSWFTWRDILHLVDIVCCCAVLFPIVWSIKHLREASQTDGKAARNLAKLQLFRHFYVMVVSYIYFTRIIVYLLRSSLPYQWVWVSDVANQIATLLFYTLTAVYFRPHADNPYLALGLEDADADWEAQQHLQQQPKSQRSNSQDL